MDRRTPVDDFQVLVSAYVDREGEPDPIKFWTIEHLRKLIDMCKAELAQRASPSSASAEPK